MVRLGQRHAGRARCRRGRNWPKASGMARPEMVLPPRNDEGGAGKDGQGGERRDEGQDADEADQHAVDERRRRGRRAARGRPPARSDSRAAKRTPATMPERLAMEPTLRVEIAHHHDDGHAGGDDHQHRELLGDVQPVARRHEGVGQAEPEEDEDQRRSRSACRSGGGIERAHAATALRP